MSQLVFNASPFSHFARAGELETLERLVSKDECFVTQAVLDELEQGSVAHDALAEVRRLEWITVVPVDSLAELQAFAEYSRRLGSGPRDVGEASTLAWAETHDAIAVIDERAGTRHARERGVQVHGTLWLIAQGLLAGLLTGERSEALVAALRDAEAWFPVFEDSFVAWARDAGLL